MAGSGYEYRPGSFPDGARHLFFRKVDDDGKRLAHLHVVDGASSEIDDYRTFRAFLHANPEAGRRYAGVKLTLAARFADRRQACVHAKRREVDVLIVEARQWAASRRRTGPAR